MTDLLQVRDLHVRFAAPGGLTAGAASRSWGEWRGAFSRMGLWAPQPGQRQTAPEWPGNDSGGVQGLRR